MDDFEDLNFLASPFQKISCPVFRFTFILFKGRLQLKKKSDFPDLLGGWVWKSPFSRFKKIKKYVLRKHKIA